MIRAFALTLTALAMLAVPALAEDDGAALFETHCAACHGAAGVGTPGFAPALDRPEFWQALGDDAPAYLSGVITKGFAAPITVRGERFAGMVMPAVAGVPDEELAGIANWVLSGLGQVNKSVAPEDLAASRDSDLTHADLKAMRPETE